MSLYDMLHDLGTIKSNGNTTETLFQYVYQDFVERKIATFFENEEDKYIAKLLLRILKIGKQVNIDLDDRTLATFSLLDICLSEYVLDTRNRHGFLQDVREIVEEKEHLLNYFEIIYKENGFDLIALIDSDILRRNFEVESLRKKITRFEEPPMVYAEFEVLMDKILRLEGMNKRDQALKKSMTDDSSTDEVLLPPTFDYEGDF